MYKIISTFGKNGWLQFKQQTAAPASHPRACCKPMALIDVQSRPSNLNRRALIVRIDIVPVSLKFESMPIAKHRKI